MKTSTTTICWLMIAAIGTTNQAGSIPFSQLVSSPDVTLDMGGQLAGGSSLITHLAGGATGVSEFAALPRIVNLDAYHLLTSGDALFSVDSNVSVGGITIGPADVIRHNGGSYSVEFSTTSHGVPPGVNLDALTADAQGNLVMSFDTAIELGGIDARRSDLVLYDGATFTRVFHGTAEGVPTGLGLDAVHRLLPGEVLLLSFDGSGEIDGQRFDDDDVMRFDPQSGDWQLAWAGDEQLTPWLGANLDALFAGVAGAGWVSESLRLNKMQGESISLSWDPSCSPDDSDYAVYEGELGDFATHVPIDQEFCTTNGLTQTTFTPQPDSRYYLVVPQTAVGEGSYGATSGGTPRSVGFINCAPQLMDICE